MGLKNMIKKVCVVGGGNWGKNHVKTLHELNSLGGVVDKDRNLLENYKKKYPYVDTFDDLDKAISASFDGYIVATPAPTHFKIAEKIIKSKNHLLVEKPITTNLNDAIELNRLAKEYNVNLMVGHVLLFHPAFLKIKEILDLGKLGDIQYIYSNRLNLGKIRTNENVFLSFAPHDIALFQFFTNSIPIKIISTGKDFLQEGIHDTTLSIFEYENNIMGHIFVSWLHPFKEHRFIIVGTKGMISFEDSRPDKPLTLYDKNIDWGEGIPKPNDGSSIKINYEKSMPLENELKYFIKHLDGKPIVLANGDSAVDVIKILENVSKRLTNSGD